MAKWLQSGLRRDVCVVVAARDDPTGQEVKRVLEERYDDRVRPKQFYGALDALVEAGHLSRTADGLTDRFALTEAGEAALAAHYGWVCETLPPAMRAGAAE
jgi:DNA-binding PadR family transcriptional regulator